MSNIGAAKSEETRITTFPDLPPADQILAQSSQAGNISLLIFTVIVDSEAPPVSLGLPPGPAASWAWAIGQTDVEPGAKVQGKE